MSKTLCQGFISKSFNNFYNWFTLSEPLFHINFCNWCIKTYTYNNTYNVDPIYNKFILTYWWTGKLLTALYYKLSYTWCYQLKISLVISFANRWFLFNYITFVNRKQNNTNQKCKLIRKERNFNLPPNMYSTLHYLNVQVHLIQLSYYFSIVLNGCFLRVGRCWCGLCFLH